MTAYTATYSPDDNKIRLYASTRLDPETYARVKAAGFAWAPKQGLFVAPMWTPGREDLALELAGEIDDEDTSLVDRAEERADRFGDYADNRAADAEQARKAVAAIADNIPFGQPILIGHHSERHARKDQERITNGMRRAVKMWETSEYWQSRAKGALRAAKYKELPPVRARRIKGLEADQSKQTKEQSEADRFLKAWHKVGNLANDPDKMRAAALHVANFGHVSRCFPLADYPRDPPASQYEGQMSLWSALDAHIITPEQACALAIPAHERTIARCSRWLAHLANRLAYERAMQTEAGGTVADKTGPEKGGACRCWASPHGGWSYIQKINKVSVSVLDNWGNGGANFRRIIELGKLTAVMTAAQVKEASDAGRLIETKGGIGFHLADTPPPAPRESRDTVAAEPFDAMRATLKAGITVAVVPQLFPTPAGVADEMAALAQIEQGQRILEPSAGTGNLLAAIDRHRGPPAYGDMGERAREGGCDIVAVELNSRLAATLPSYLCGHAIQADFLTCNGDLGTFVRIPVILIIHSGRSRSPIPVIVIMLLA